MKLYVKISEKEILNTLVEKIQYACHEQQRRKLYNKERVKGLHKTYEEKRKLKFVHCNNNTHITAMIAPKLAISKSVWRL